MSNCQISPGRIILSIAFLTQDTPLNKPVDICKLPVYDGIEH